MDKYVLITGASSGLGKATALELLNHGYEVFGCNRGAPTIEDEHFHPICADVSKQADIDAAKEEVLKITDKLDAIINIAGIMLMGPVVEIPGDRMQQIMNINLIGMYRVNQTFFPLVKNANGRIINFSSEYGTYPTVPFNTFYTTAKRAVEAYTDGLRRELAFAGIKVITVRPGAFKTNMEKSTGSAFEKAIDSTQYFKKPLRKMKPMLENGTNNAKDPAVLAKVVAEAVTSASPRRVYCCNHNLLSKAMRLTPPAILDKMFYIMFR